MTTSNTNATLGSHTLGSQTYHYFCSSSCMTTALAEMTRQQLIALYGYTKEAPSTSIKWTAHHLVQQELAERVVEATVVVKPAVKPAENVEGEG